MRYITAVIITAVYYTKSTLKEEEASDRDYDSIQENAGILTAPRVQLDLLTTSPKRPASFAIHYCITYFGSSPVCMHTRVYETYRHSQSSAFTREPTY